MLTPELLRMHVERVAAQGYTIVQGAVDTALCDALLEDLGRLERELGAAPAANVFEGTKTVRIYNLLARGPLYAQIPVHASVLPIVEQVLDRGCLVSSLSSIAIGAGETAQPIHADDQLIPLPKPRPAIVCNSMWALTDFTEENGATRIVPNTHLADHSPNPFDPHETIGAVMKQGSVLVWNGSMWHGGGANTTSERRVGIAMNYCAGYLRQQENQQLGIPLEVARGFSPRLRKLCGFGLYKKLIGHIDKCSPEDILDGSGPRPVVGG